MKKKILIVGGTGFIGYHLAKICLKKNFLVTSLSFGKPKKERYLKKVKYIKCDISNEQEVENLYNESTKIGHVNCVINNAGIGIFSKINEMKVGDWDKQMGVNLRGSFLITKKLLKLEYWYIIGNKIRQPPAGDGIP